MKIKIPRLKIANTKHAATTHQHSQSPKSGFVSERLSGIENERYHQNDEGQGVYERG